MANVRKYKNAQEAKEARNAQIQRYKAEKTVNIQANLPPEYAEKLNICAEKMNISKAQVLRMCIDTLYNELEGEKGKSE